MTAPTGGGRRRLGTCAGCGYPVYQGDDRWETLDQGTSASPDVLLHRNLCVRRGGLRIVPPGAPGRPS